MNAMTLNTASAMEVFQTLPENFRAEVIDNELIHLPAARLIHQQVIWNLSVAMTSFVEKYKLGKFIGFQLDVYLNEHNVVQPDAMFIANDQLHNLRDNGLFGVPQMIIEVLSPGNKRHDQVTKKALYERFGVAEYWIIDPDVKLATGFVQRDGSYVQFQQLFGALKPEVFGKEFSY